MTQIYIHTHSLPKLHVILSDTCYSILLCFIIFKECCSQSTKLISSPLKDCNPELENCCCQPEQCPQVPTLALLSLNGTLQAGYLLAWHSLSVISKLLSVHVNSVDPKWLALGMHVTLLRCHKKTKEECWTLRCTSTDLHAPSGNGRVPGG